MFIHIYGKNLTIHVHTQTDGHQDRHGNIVLNVNIKINVTDYYLINEIFLILLQLDFTLVISLILRPQRHDRGFYCCFLHLVSFPSQ